MIKIELSGYQLEIDKEATTNTYKQISSGGCKGCGCDYCKNFSLALSTVFPKEILDFFALAGVDIKKDTEVYEFNEELSGEHLYGGEYHLWGKVLEEPKIEATIGKKFTFEFSERSQLVQNEFNKTGAVCFSFSAILPWLLNKKT